MTRAEFFLKLEQAGYRSLADFCKDNNLQYNKTNNFIHARTEYPEAESALNSIGISRQEFPI